MRDKLGISKAFWRVEIFLYISLKGFKIVICIFNGAIEHYETLHQKGLRYLKILNLSARSKRNIYCTFNFKHANGLQSYIIKVSARKSKVLIYFSKSPPNFFGKSNETVPLIVKGP
jgi:hypothetical protein